MGACGLLARHSCTTPVSCSWMPERSHQDTDIKGQLFSCETPPCSLLEWCTIDELGTITMRLSRVRMLVVRIPMVVTSPQVPSPAISMRSPTRNGWSIKMINPAIISSIVSRAASECAKPPSPNAATMPVIVSRACNAYQRTFSLLSPSRVTRGFIARVSPIFPNVLAIVLRTYQLASYVSQMKGKFSISWAVLYVLGAPDFSQRD